jgi:hypothetical protein
MRILEKLFWGNIGPWDAGHSPLVPAAQKGRLAKKKIEPWSLTAPSKLPSRGGAVGNRTLDPAHGFGHKFAVIEPGAVTTNRTNRAWQERGQRLTSGPPPPTSARAGVWALKRKRVSRVLPIGYPLRGFLLGRQTTVRNELIDQLGKTLA